eukprot:scaffold108989_cov24-Prasinocladus_malaysianus.AAC.1
MVQGELPSLTQPVWCYKQTVAWTVSCRFGEANPYSKGGDSADAVRGGPACGRQGRRSCVRVPLHDVPRRQQRPGGAPAASAGPV